MPPTIRGVYREGKIELAETPPDVCEGIFVVVTFFHLSPADLQECGIDGAEAAEIWARLASFAEDLDRPEVSVYDSYDEAKAKLQAR